MLRENRLISTASPHDARRQGDVRRAVVSVLADREEHSIIANLVCWVVLLSAYIYIGLTPLILLALTLRLAAMTATRLACARLRAELREGRPFERSFRLAQLSLCAAGLSWAMMIWPLLDGSPVGFVEMAVFGLVTAGYIAICSLIGLHRPALFGFAIVFVASVFLGSLVMAGAVNWLACLAIVCPFLGAVPFGLGTGRQALQAAKDAVDNRYLREELATSLHNAEFLSRHDPLTGLLNRRALFSDAGPSSADRVVITLDMDQFKSINDTYGHQVGDDVLVAVGQVLRRVERKFEDRACRAARLGGEEFLLILNENHEEMAMAVADAVRAEVASAFPISSAPGLFATASLGVAFWPQGTALNCALARSDKALYRAKRKGRNRVVAASEGFEAAREAA